MPNKKRAIGKIRRKKNSNPIKRKNYLFTIGINDYKHCDNLNNAVKDTNDIADLLFEKYDFDKENYFSLENKEATKDNVIAKFREIKKKLTSNDNLIVYYSGHGELDEDFNDSYWVTSECRKEKIGDYLPFGQIITFLKAINIHHILLVVDACYAGAKAAEQFKKVNIRESAKSRYIIASGRKELASDGKIGENSPFAKPLLEKLNQVEESISAPALGEYILERTCNLTENGQTPFHTRLVISDDEGGDFIFHKKIISEESVWENSLEVNSIKVFKQYLQKFPKGKNIEEAYWKIASLKNTINSFDDYLEKFSNGKYADEAEERMEEIEHDENWARWKKNDTLVSYRKYLRKYSKGKHRAEAEVSIQRIRSENQEVEPEVPQKTNKNSNPKRTIELKPSDFDVEKLSIPSHIIKNLNLFIDPRDGQTYKTVKLKDGNIWMAQNLNFDTGKDCWHYDNDSKHGKKYGRLYTWETAKKACPKGWHMPSDEEWRIMIEKYGDTIDDNLHIGFERKALIELIEGGRSEFSVNFSGSRFEGESNKFTGLGYQVAYWSSTKYTNNTAWCYIFDIRDAEFYRYNNDIYMGSPCRCIRD